jgi:DMSO/TMAO reductase YedYZ molybdopterin-dependent catalytic subunit
MLRGNRYPRPACPEAFVVIRTASGICILLILLSCCAGCTGTAPASSPQPVTNSADDFSSWNLTVNGSALAVYTLDQIRQLPATTGNGFAVSTVGIKFGPYICKGVLLTDLLEPAGGISPGDQVWIYAPDGYLWVFDYDQVQGNGFITFNENLKEIPSPSLRILLMYEQDGKALSYNDGGPLRVAIISNEKGVVTEGSAWVKWVNKIEIKKK